MNEEEPQVVPERRDFTPMARELFVNFQAVEPTVEWLKAAQGAVELSSGFAGLVENIIATVSVATIPWRQQRQTFFEQFVKNTLPLERERDPSLPQSDFHPKVKELLVQRFKEYAESEEGLQSFSERIFMYLGFSLERGTGLEAGTAVVAVHAVGRPEEIRQRLQGKRLGRELPRRLPRLQR
jgi:hypothetical protein